MIYTRTLLNDVYARLGDPTRSIYTINRIISLINKALRNISTNTNIFHKSITIAIQDKQSKISMPKDFFQFVRVQTKKEGRVIPFITYEEMDNKVRDWQNKEGAKIENIVFNHMNMGEVVLYPKVSNKIDSGYKSNSLYGMITKIETTQNYDIIETKEEYGMYEFVEHAVLDIIYNSIPNDVVSEEDSIDVPEMIADAVALFVVSEALKDSIATQNIEKASYFYAEYQIKIDEFVKNATSKNYSNHDRTYRNIAYSTYP